MLNTTRQAFPKQTLTESSVSDPSSDRRTEVRKRSMKKGVIAFNSRYCVIECVVRNHTSGGAMLKVDQNQMIPKTIEFKIPGETEFRVARIAWRSEKAIGIAFEGGNNQRPEPSAQWSNGESQPLRQPRRFGH